MSLLNGRVFLLLLLLPALALAAGGCDCDDDDDDDVAGDDDQAPGDDDTADDDAVDDDTADDDTADDDTADDDTVSPAEPFIEEGKKYLRAAAGDLARQQFLLGLEADPEHEGVWYGIVLSDILHDFDTVSILWAYIEMFLGFQPPEMPKDPPQSGQSFIDDLVNIALEGLLVESSNELTAWVEQLYAERPDVIFELDRMPIIFNFEEVADAHGDFDIAEAVAAEAVARVLCGAVEHALALNLDFNLGIIFEMMEVNWDQYPIDELIGLVVDYLLAMIDDPIFPDFLTLKDDAELYRTAGIKVGLGFRRAAQTYALMVSDQESQDNEVLGYQDLNGDREWSENEPLIVPPWGVLDGEQNEAAWVFEELFGQLADSFLDYTEYDSDPDNSQPFRLAYLNPVLDTLGLWGIIPDWDSLVIDFGANYRDADPTALRDQLVLILKIADMFLP